MLFTGRDETKLEETYCLLAAKYPGRKLDYVISDATDLSEENFEAIVERCRNKDIRILINNAGISHGQWKLQYL